MVKKPATKPIFDIPAEVSRVTKALEKANFEAFLVGGCVRDLMIGRSPKDWDVATNATPEEIIALFPETYYENTFGTVGVVNEETEDPTLKIVEVTPYRLESEYSDKRRPDAVEFSKNIEDDLKRRDFTINAIAYNVSRGTIDLFNGQEDLEKKLIRAVGNADERFSEDALRMLRAIRLQAELGFVIEAGTEEALSKNAPKLSHIAEERIRDEFTRIIASDNPLMAIFMAQKLGILREFLPELEESIKIEQGGAHAYDVWEHLLRALQHTADKKWPIHVRLAALFHDIGKPRTRGAGKHKEYSFYGHEVVGARMTKKIMERLRFSKDLTEKVVNLIRWHMFFSDTEQITLTAVRRLLSKVGKDNIWDLINLRIADRVGTGRPKEQPYRLRKYKSMIEQVMSDPVSLNMLAVDGQKVMEVTRETPGPKIGFILHALFEEVLDDPKKNTEEFLVKRIDDLKDKPLDELKALGDKGKEKKSAEEDKQVAEIRKKHGVE